MKSPYTTRAVVVLSSMVALLCAGMPASLASTAHVRLDVSDGPPSTAVEVEGQGFQASEIVDLAFDGHLLVWVPASLGGHLRQSIVVPPGATLGNHGIIATGESSGLSARATFRVHTDWSQFGFDAAHTGANPFETILSRATVGGLAETWVGSTGDTDSQPTVVGATVFVASRTSLTAIDMRSGAPLWTTSVNTISSSPSVANDLVYLGTSQGVDVFDRATGVPVWTAPIGSARFSSPTIDGHTLYVGAEAGGVYALNATNGRVLWAHQTSESVWSSPAVWEGKVYAGSTDGWLYALDASDGSVLWKRNTKGYLLSSAAVADGHVYISTGAHVVSAYDAETGVLLWDAAAGESTSTPSAANGVVFAGTIYGALYAVDATDGHTLWNAIPGGLESEINTVVANGVVYTGTVTGLGHGSVVAYDAVTGSSVFYHNLDAEVFGTPTVVNGWLFVGEAKGSTHAFSLP